MVHQCVDILQLGFLSCPNCRQDASFRIKTAKRKAFTSLHKRMARGGHELPKVSPGLAMPNPSMPYGWATPKTVLQLFQDWPTYRAGGLRPSTTPLDSARRTYMHLSDLSQKYKTYCFLDPKGQASLFTISIEILLKAAIGWKAVDHLFTTVACAQGRRSWGSGGLCKTLI
jgi:hypothetical protein